ncbi:DNA alkylation repair protein [Treponema brennaborense]|uniref:DNA alkylation repair enzyme n=1 Tax=Treponema brennaborense (strain DSM 12168 / CIP 105900 / DD5/3) TaxID=906968 RepID=F4LP73_TREBD|nr:DNA alkylation repair protein [Treponema brennaborense]AEE15949.1 hypothetical protein Trebr_0506 [Treponema brennaborense DSM 12168]
MIPILKNSETAAARDLFALQDTAYRAFHAKLVPTLDAERIIGVRTPALRAYAAQCAAKWTDGEKRAFYAAVPHYYYEENNLHAFLLARQRVPGDVPFDRAMSAVDAFLPYIDNWATCDMFAPKFFAAYPARVLPFVRRWLASGRTYTVRFAVVTLLQFFLDENFTPEIPELAASCPAGDYYADMAVAWFFSTALVKRYDSALPYLTERRLSVWVHNKTIQKAVESRCVSAETKTYLRSLKI